ncbi:MAG TPA: hypothetical protein VGP61_10290 [Gemmatimonadales bacterium]|jgi:hypothetical protein|nr:hypothetical protein [Gemmatimonadales bacterium]
MRRVPLLTVTLILSWSLAPAQGAPQSQYAVCTSEPWQPTVYLSNAFSFPSSTPYATLAAAYKKTLMEKYEYEGNVTCWTYQSQAAADLELRRNATAVGRTRKVIETKWSYLGAPVPAPAPPPAPAPGAPARPAAPDDPRLGSLSAEERKWAVDEYPVAVGYCENNLKLQSMFPCDRFGRAVLNFRIIHAKEKFPAEDRSGRMVWIPLINVISDSRFDCSGCLEEAKTKHWADSIATGQNAAAGAKAWGDCFAKEFTTRFRASPSILGERGVENEARILCSQRFPPKPYVPSP